MQHFKITPIMRDYCALLFHSERQLVIIIVG